MKFYFVYNPHQVQAMAEVAELERIALLPSFPEKTVVKPNSISNWFWFAALVCVGIIFSVPYLIR